MRKYEVGMKINTRKSGVVEILEIKGRKFKVKFLNDNSIIVTGASNITNNSIKNPNEPNVYGKGFIGFGKNKPTINRKATKEYALWVGMLKRCYSEMKNTHRSRCYLECTVDERWHNFQNFCEDLPKLENYNKWVEFGRKYHLDKDFKIKGNKFYSLETCMFLDQTLNCGMSAENRKSTAIKVFLYKDGVKILEGSLKEIAVFLNLSYTVVKARYYNKTFKDGYLIKNR